MGGRTGIRSGTNFANPLREAFKRMSSDERGVFVWYSDGVEHINKGCEETKIQHEINTAFPEKIDDMDWDVCTATFGNNCGENTKMQQLSSYWDENSKRGRGFFTTSDKIPLLAKFAYESIEPRFTEPLATDIEVITPDERDDPIIFKQLNKNPIDITFKLPVSYPLRVGVPNTPFGVISATDFIMLKFKNSHGDLQEIKYKLIDGCQIKKTGKLVNSQETNTAHILNEVKNLSDTVTGLPSKITEELPINKKCLELLSSLGEWNYSPLNGNTWNPKIYRRCGKNYPVTAPHQIPSKNQFDMLKTAIRAAENINNSISSPSLIREASEMYSAATVEITNCSREQSQGYSSRSAYNHRVSNYGCSLD